MILKGIQPSAEKYKVIFIYFTPCLQCRERVSVRKTVSAFPVR